VRLFHYHLVTSKVRQAEARYLGKLGFSLVTRYGRIGDEQASFEAGTPWEELDRLGFRLRLSELQRGAVNVVLQPGHWEVPRVDHLGVMLDEDDFADVLARADALGLRVQEHAGRRTFVATNAGYRLEVHPPRDWIVELLIQQNELRLVELQLRADDPGAKAAALRELLEIQASDSEVGIGETVVRFVPGGPQGRPELHAERFE
jgi:catechol 2,3-dioxygenase-like lactoylglutathione lyase family enzyme